MNVESSAYISDTLRALEENLAMLIDMKDMMSKEEETLVTMLHGCWVVGTDGEDPMLPGMREDQQSNDVLTPEWEEFFESLSDSEIKGYRNVLEESGLRADVEGWVIKNLEVDQYVLFREAMRSSGF